MTVVTGRCGPPTKLLTKLEEISSKLCVVSARGASCAITAEFGFAAFSAAASNRLAGAVLAGAWVALGAWLSAPPELRSGRMLRVLPAMGIVVVLVALPFVPGNTLLNKILVAVLVIVFGFIFVTVSSRIVGLIGSSSNPISGMTIATLMAQTVDAAEKAAAEVLLLSVFI